MAGLVEIEDLLALLVGGWAQLGMPYLSDEAVRCRRLVGFGTADGGSAGGVKAGALVRTVGAADLYGRRLRTDVPGSKILEEDQQAGPVVRIEVAEAYQYKFIFLRLRYYVIAAQINRFTNCSPKLWRGPILACLT